MKLVINGSWRKQIISSYMWWVAQSYSTLKINFTKSEVKEVERKSIYFLVCSSFSAGTVSKRKKTMSLRYKRALSEFLQNCFHKIMFNLINEKID